MQADAIYYYQKSRKQRSITFINMAVACLVYIAGLYAYEYYTDKPVSENFKLIYISAFSISSIILFYVAWWHRKNPATYEAIITTDRFFVHYPGSQQWSFDIKVADIKRFENRNTLSHAGRGIGESGVVLKDGRFYEICMNYGSNINEMYAAVKTVRPDITFPKRVNKKVEGLLSKDYDD